MKQKKFILPESEIPTAWFNIQAIMPNKPLPILHPGTRQPLKAEDDLLHARGTAHRRKKRILRAFFVKMVFAVGKAQRVAVAKSRHCRSCRRRRVAGTWLDFYYRRIHAYGQNHPANCQ